MNPPVHLPHTHVEPSRGWIPIQLGELWAYRELVFFLVWRDLKVRYKQTALGAAWAVLQPFMTMVVFTVFFNRLGGIQSGGDIPYPLFTFTALLPWQLFAYAINESGNSLVANQRLITKVYFPRLAIPLAAVLAGLADFAIAFVFLAGMLVYYGYPVSLRVLLLPVFLLFAIATALAVGLWLSALNVQYRDVRYVLPFLTQLWLFLTPIAYPSSNLPEWARPLYGLNPMAGVVEGFRWALLGQEGGVGPVILVSALMVVVLLAGGLVYFRRMERTFADIV